ncbi:MAG: GDSL-type esterase/lipase family protein [Bermanella sp.]
MKTTFFSHKLAILSLLFLSIGLSITAWKMHQYKDRFQEITDNQRWENILSENNVYDENSIVFLGDSQIARWKMAPSFGSLPILNRGISGDWALKALERFDKDVLELKPKLLVLLIGTNDLEHGQSIDEILSNIEIMLKEAHEQDIKVILCSLLPVRGQYIKDRPINDILKINDHLSGLSIKHIADYVDFHSELIDNEGTFTLEFTSDGLHPNRQGYMKMSKIIFPYLIKNISKIFKHTD